MRAPEADRSNPNRKVLGYDAAGIVEAVGADVTLFKPGDAVFYAGDITRAGSNAEYQLVDERIVGRKPATLDFAQAAALAADRASPRGSSSSIACASIPMAADAANRC